MLLQNSLQSLLYRKLLIFVSRNRIISDFNHGVEPDESSRRTLIMFYLNVTLRTQGT